MASEPEPQHLAALRGANVVRLARAALWRRVASGETDLADVLRDPPDEILTVTVHKALTWQWAWGSCKATKLLYRARLLGAAVDEAKTVGALTARQRAVLADLLSARPRR